ncbi:uncharacterized protein LOC119320500 isoform X2 [Triticum dicoccoides]|uniref:uncharacterized protein LOC119320500 isoform X2 n=1 Tax=Triticum dicoccoides TaxID=85692 RepID=UPI0018916A05|nr:uncharacterized protein LOC119320500 isoform X2 [Triticum dicoccoides]
MIQTRYDFLASIAAGLDLQSTPRSEVVDGGSFVMISGDVHNPMQRRLGRMGRTLVNPHQLVDGNGGVRVGAAAPGRTSCPNRRSALEKAFHGSAADTRGNV